MGKRFRTAYGWAGGGSYGKPPKRLGDYKLPATKHVLARSAMQQYRAYVGAGHGRTLARGIVSKRIRAARCNNPVRYRRNGKTFTRKCPTR